MVFPQRYAHCQIQLKNKFSRHVGIAEIRPWVITIKVPILSSSICKQTLLIRTRLMVINKIKLIFENAAEYRMKI